MTISLIIGYCFVIWIHYSQSYTYFKHYIHSIHFILHSSLLYATPFDVSEFSLVFYLMMNQHFVMISYSIDS